MDWSGINDTKTYVLFDTFLFHDKYACVRPVAWRNASYKSPKLSQINIDLGSPYPLGVEMVC